MRAIGIALLVLAAIGFAALCAPLLYGQTQFQTQTISVSGAQITITNNLGATQASFGYVIQGGPATVSLVIQGCLANNTCSTLDTYTLTANATRTPAISQAYAYFTVTGTWTGGASPSVVVNSSLTIPSTGGSLSVTTKGDLQTFSTVPTRLGVGTDGQCLTAQSGQTTGLSWAACPGGGGTVTDDNSTNVDIFPVWSSSSSGTLSPKVSSTKLTFNPSTGRLTATGYSTSGNNGGLSSPASTGVNCFSTGGGTGLAGSGCLWFDSGANRFKMNNNAVADVTLMSTSDAASISQLPASTKVRSCDIAIGDGQNAVAAATYSALVGCKNDTGATITITGVQCYTNAGTSTCDAKTSAGGTPDILTGPVTGSNVFAAGTQSATTTILNTQWLTGTLVADGTTKRIVLHIIGTL